MAATNRNLEEAIKGGTFRADLYHRLDVVKFTMPTLRDRREDIPLLAGYFAEKYAKECKRQINGISPEARTMLQSYEWPGNVRELENAIERAAVLGSSETIGLDDLPHRVLDAARDPSVTSAKYHDAVEDAKRQLIMNALEKANGNYTEAAKALGIHANNLHRIILHPRPEGRSRQIAVGRFSLGLKSFGSFWRCSGPQVDIVGFDLGVERSRIHPQQARSARLVTAGLIQRAPDQVDFKTTHLVIEIYSAAHVDSR